MTSQPLFKVYESVQALPKEWDELNQNIFLNCQYLTAQENALPEHMKIYYIAFYEDNHLVAKSVFQRIALQGHTHIQVNRSWKNPLKNLLNTYLLCVGNIKITGENAYDLSADLDIKQFLPALHKAIQSVEEISKKEGKKIQLVLLKDFYAAAMPLISSFFQQYTPLAVEPNMVLEIPSTWQTETDYISAMKSKYRTRTHRAFKKAEGISFRALTLDEIKQYEEVLYQLYLQVLDQVNFSFYQLPQNYFQAMKEALKDKFIVYAGFQMQRMVCFFSLIQNQKVLETGFLGYDAKLQQAHQLYLNMLYQMIFYGVENHYTKIIFSRSALEIKSSVGAEPLETYGLLKHSNLLLNKGAAYYLIRYISLNLGHNASLLKLR